MRQKRDEGIGAIHHVVPQGNGRRPIVEDDRDRAAYVNRFDRVRCNLEWIVYANCLMDTHHHSVVETPEPNLGLGMKRVQGGHARYLNLRHGGEGHVFRQRFWSRRLLDEASLLNACLYTVLNPVAAGLCGHPIDWPWCSYTATADGDPEQYGPGEDLLLSMFGDSPGEARRRYAEVVAAAAEAIHAERVSRGEALWARIDAVAASARRAGV
jgi:REP element-mobilizing transposase RayT